MNNNTLKLNIGEELGELEIKLMKDEIDTLPILEDDRVNFHTLYVCEVDKHLETRILIRSTVKNPIFLEKLKLILVDANKKSLGQQVVSFDFLGELPPCSITPATILLDKENFNIANTNLTDCKIIVSTNISGINSTKVKLNYLDESIDEVNKRMFEKLIDQNEPINDNSCEIRAPKIVITQDNFVSVPLIIFNGYSNEFTINNFKIIMKDSLNIVKAQKVVTELPVKVEPYTANVYNFIFDENEIYAPIEELKLCKISISN